MQPTSLLHGNVSHHHRCPHQQLILSLLVGLVAAAGLCIRPCASVSVHSHESGQVPCPIDNYLDDVLEVCQPCSNICDPKRGTIQDCLRHCGTSSTLPATTSLPTRAPPSGDDVTLPTRLTPRPVVELTPVSERPETNHTITVLSVIMALIGLLCVLGLVVTGLVFTNRVPSHTDKQTADHHKHDSESITIPATEDSDASKSALCINSRVYKSPSANCSDDIRSTERTPIAEPLLPAGDQYQGI